MNFCLNQYKYRKVKRFKSNKRSHSGDNGSKDPPVPIPNTEVKLTRAESTDLDTNWGIRELPDFKKYKRYKSASFIF